MIYKNELGEEEESGGWSSGEDMNKSKARNSKLCTLENLWLKRLRSRSCILISVVRLLIIIHSEVSSCSGSHWYVLIQLFWSKMHCPIFKIKEVFFQTSWKSGSQHDLVKNFIQKRTRKRTWKWISLKIVSLSICKDTETIYFKDV